MCDDEVLLYSFQNSFFLFYSMLICFLLISSQFLAYIFYIIYVIIQKCKGKSIVEKSVRIESNHPFKKSSQNWIKNIIERSEKSFKIILLGIFGFSFEFSCIIWLVFYKRFYFRIISRHFFFHHNDHIFEIKKWKME